MPQGVHIYLTDPWACVLLSQHIHTHTEMEPKNIHYEKFLVENAEHIYSCQNVTVHNKVLETKTQQKFFKCAQNMV